MTPSEAVLVLIRRAAEASEGNEAGYFANAALIIAQVESYITLSKRNNP